MTANVQTALGVGTGLLISAVIAFAAEPCEAGETIKFRSTHVNVATMFESQEVGDEPGHIVGFFSAKGVGVRYEGPAEEPYKIDIWGSGDYGADGTGSDGGYGKFTFDDGSFYYERWHGEVADGKDVGTAEYYGGSGRFEGLSGGSKFDCALLGDRFVCDVEGTIELP